ncbi:hypothetical protein ASZ90_001872 [hydrocarbon metagenome]|uniref:Uncharacterized protein n=1 Tax=hydrocarbon metagenome TaxID=938273 RepID=A0A0W8G5L7_9ZZZZ
MVSTASISSVGSLRPFLERAFRRNVSPAPDAPHVPASCAAPLPQAARPPQQGLAMDNS